MFATAGKSAAFSVVERYLLLNSVTCYASTVLPPNKRSPYQVRILPSDILGRRRPVGFVRESYPVRGGTL
jgi:hypothetical protein